MRFAPLALLLAAAASAAQTAAPKPQQPADQKALKAANANEDPAKRLDALQQWLRAYPKSSSRLGAQFSILDLLVKHFPDRETTIDAQARQLLKQSKKIGGKDYTEGMLAEKLASGGPKPVDLEEAEKWARADADHAGKLSEAEFRKRELKDSAKYKEPAPTAAALRRDYNEHEAEAMEPLADVLLRKGDLAGAAKLLDRAGALDPMSADVSRLGGELALAQGDKTAALARFEKAQLTGDLPKPLRVKMQALYREAHGGSDAGLEDELDRKYTALYPPAAPQTKQPPANGRTILLELFTGSACGPCVGGDAAVEEVLAAYPRSEVVALAFDQHIPEPDPLANADTVARAEAYGSQSTPNYFLDGAKLPFYGGGRGNADELYGKLAKAIDAEIAKPSAVRLSLASHLDGTAVEATAALAMPGTLDPAPPPAPEQNSGNGAKPAPKPPAPKPPQLALQFALVEDEVRYSGENGVRFHRMLVRSLAPAQTLALGAHADLHASFDPQGVGDKLHAYLADFSAHSERFGKVEFLSTETTLNPKRLAVAAWVEDTANHRVYQAAFSPVAAETAQASLAR